MSQTTATTSPFESHSQSTITPASRLDPPPSSAIGETNLVSLLANLKVTVHPDIYIYTTIPNDTSIGTTHESSKTSHDISTLAPNLSDIRRHDINIIPEAEGLTLIMPRHHLTSHSTLHLQPELHTLLVENMTYPCRKVTLDVHSSLDAVGFMATIATNLAQKNISVNPVAGWYHDHLFVAQEKVEQVVRCLEEVVSEARAKIRGTSSTG